MGGQSRTSASEFISGLVGALETIFRCKLSKDHKTIRIMASLRILLLLRPREHFSRAFLVEIVKNIKESTFCIIFDYFFLLSNRREAKNKKNRIMNRS